MIIQKVSAPSQDDTLRFPPRKVPYMSLKGPALNIGFWMALTDGLVNIGFRWNLRLYSIPMDFLHLDQIK